MICMVFREFRTAIHLSIKLNTQVLKYLSTQVLKYSRVKLKLKF